MNGNITRVSCTVSAAFSGENPPAKSWINCGAKRIPASVSPLSTTTIIVAILFASSQAEAVPSLAIFFEKVVTKAVERAPSAKRSRKRFGTLNAIMNASIPNPAPNSFARINSRARPRMRLHITASPTAPAARAFTFRELLGTAADGASSSDMSEGEGSGCRGIKQPETRAPPVALTRRPTSATLPALMSKPTLAPLVLLAASLLISLPLEAAVLYRSTEGWTVEGEAGDLDPVTAEQMTRAEAAETEGNLGAALDGYRLLVKRWPNSPVAPKAQRKVGILLERSGQYNKAFEADELYLTKYPRGDDFDSVVESMFKIAKIFLDSEKKKLLGVPVGSQMPRAQAMFESIVKKAPFSKWAPLAQFNAGQALEKQVKYPEAIAAYQAVVNRYPTDAIADDALYQIGYVRLRDYREGSYDRASALKAREAFEDFINRYPESEKTAQARENLKTLEGGQVKGALQIAKFYDKTKQYKAAVIYYNDVIKQQPDSPDSTFAKTRIAALREQVGEDALRAGPEKTETGARAVARRKLQAKVDTASRPDYVGPPVVVAQQPIETAPGRPQLRTSPQNLGPVPAVEPPLPTSQPEAPKPAPEAATPQ